MSSFRLQLYSATCSDQIDGVIRFVGTDASGQFGLLAHHARLITVLNYGLARYCLGADQWRWLALPGAVLRFCDNQLSITTRRYVHHPDYDRISAALETELRAEERRLGTLRDHIERLEREMFRKLWQTQRR